MPAAKVSPANTATAVRAESRALYALVGASFFIETDRLESFVAVYLITFKDWNEVWVGYVSLVLNIVMLIFQTPIGDYLDRSTRDRLLVALAIATAAVTTMAVAWTSQLWAIILIKAIEGLAAAFFRPGLMSLLLGVVPNSLVPTAVKYTETSNTIGSVLFMAIAGIVAYYEYPDVRAVFYVLGGAALVGAGCILVVPETSIDHAASRGLTERNAAMLIQDYYRQKQAADSSDKSQGTKAAETPLAKETETTKAASYITVVKDKGILMFAVLTFLYHFTNAAVTPLVAQVSAEQDARTALTFTSAIIGIRYAVQAPTAWYVCTHYQNWGYKRPLLFAHILIPVRCCIAGILSMTYPNEYLLAATSIFDGVGAGVYDTLLPLVVKSLTKGTGRFGVTFSFVITCWRLGHGFSILAGEGIFEAAHKEHDVDDAYAIALFSLGGIGLVVTLVLLLFLQLPEAAPPQDDKSASNDLASAFARFDINGDGTISKDEFITILGMTGEGLTPISAEEAGRIFDEMDADGSGTLDYTEFGAGNASLKSAGVA